MVKYSHIKNFGGGCLSLFVIIPQFTNASFLFLCGIGPNKKK